jgi:DNA-binding PadR family transcriptional regulator
MEGRKSLDPIDRTILRVLSLYEDLDLLQLWYELGESDKSVARMTEEDILERLKSLKSQGLVETIKESEGGTRWALTLKGKVAR